MRLGELQSDGYSRKRSKEEATYRSLLRSVLAVGVDELSARSVRVRFRRRMLTESANFRFELIRRSKIIDPPLPIFHYVSQSRSVTEEE
jgi:hypothetical protein